MLVNAAIALALSVGALAAPTASSSAPKELRAVLTYKKETSSTTIEVFNSDKTEFYGEADGATLNTGSFSKFPVSFDVNDVGYGKVTFGNSTYVTHSKKEHSGGAICHRKFNPGEAEVDCWLPNTSGFAPVAVEQPEKRQNINSGIQCAPLGTTFLVGDGDPHQNYFHKQISETINCGAAPSCSVGYEESESFTIGFSVSAEIDEWLTGGFDVQKSWETGNSYTCYGAEGDDVCVWYKTAHTAYTVRNKLTLQIPCANPTETLSDPVVIKSPNSNNRGGGYYCVIGTCRAKGDNYWDDTGRAGGP